MEEPSSFVFPIRASLRRYEEPVSCSRCGNKTRRCLQQAVTLVDKYECTASWCLNQQDTFEMRQVSYYMRLE